MKHWYVVRVQTGRENKVSNSLVKRVKAAGLEEHFGEIVVPTEKVSQIRRGKKSVRERKIYPGYLMIEMAMDDDAWFLVRETPGLGDFISSDGKPVPMESHEVDRMLGLATSEDDAPKVRIDFSPGDAVKIKEGPFENFDGVVEDVDAKRGMVKVQVSIFGRTTTVELEYWQVESI